MTAIFVKANNSSLKDSKKWSWPFYGAVESIPTVLEILNLGKNTEKWQRKFCVVQHMF